eukprot:jgi/Botrbrau1/16187/Bobra.0342s0004.2
MQRFSTECRKAFLSILYPTATKHQLQTLAGMACGGRMGRQRFAASQHTLEELQAMFRAGDTDGTGSLDMQEFLLVMGSAGYELEEASDMFAVIDVDGSGLIQLEEFSNWYQNEVAMADHCRKDRATTLLDTLLDWSSSSSTSTSEPSSPRHLSSSGKNKGTTSRVPTVAGHICSEVALICPATGSHPTSQTTLHRKQSGLSKTTSRNGRTAHRAANPRAQ